MLDRTFDFKIFIKVRTKCDTPPLYIHPTNVNFCSSNDAYAVPILGKSGKPEGITVYYDGTFGVLVALFKCGKGGGMMIGLRER